MTNKFFNKKTTINNIVFDSRLEADTYLQICNACKILQNSNPNYGYIVFPHANIKLVDFVSKLDQNDYDVPAIKYKIDFLVVQINRESHLISDFLFIESKGYCTKDFKIKLNLLLRKLNAIFEWSLSFKYHDNSKSDGSDHFRIIVAQNIDSFDYHKIRQMGAKVEKLSDLYSSLIDRFNRETRFKGMSIDYKFQQDPDKKSVILIRDSLLEKLGF